MSRRSSPAASARSALVLPSLVLLSSAALAPTRAEQEVAQVLPDVVVTATRLPTPASEVASSVTVITHDEIERKQERTLTDVLRDVPGLNIVQNGGTGGQTSVFMRGANPNGVKVLIDGIDVSDPSSNSGTFNFEHLLTSSIERVEVLRGPQSGLYGANTIGGVINVITRKGTGPAQLRGSVEGGSFGTFNQSAGVSGTLSRFSYDLDVAHFRNEDVQVTPSPLVVTGRSSKGNSYDNASVSTRLGTGLTDNLDVGVVAHFIDTALHFTADDLVGPESLLSEEQKQQLYTRGTAHLALFDGRFEQTLGVAYSEFHQKDLDPNFSPTSVTLFRGDRLKFDWQGNVRLAPAQVLILGAEHQLDQIDSSGPLTAEMTNDAGYLQLQSGFGERLFNTVSLRLDDNDRFGSKPTFRVAPAFLIKETDTKLKGSVGSAFNPPTLTQLFQSFPDFGFVANPNLKPETSLGFDAGFEQGLLEKRVQFGATYFHNDIDNLIAFNDTGTTLVNIGKATTYGVESFLSYKPWERLTLRGDYTFTIAKDDILDEPLLRRPKHKASLNAAWQATQAATLSATLLYVGPWLDVNRAGTASGISANGYTTVNLAGAYDLGHGLTAFGRIDNLLDRRYQDPLGFERPGIGVFAGLRVALDAATLMH
jgi:vitamin B12 transporter